MVIPRAQHCVRTSSTLHQMWHAQSCTMSCITSRESGRPSLLDPKHVAIKPASQRWCHPLGHGWHLSPHRSSQRLSESSPMPHYPGDTLQTRMVVRTSVCVTYRGNVVRARSHSATVRRHAHQTRQHIQRQTVRFLIRWSSSLWCNALWLGLLFGLCALCVLCSL